MNAPLISPDGRHLLLQRQRQLWVADVPAADAPASLSLTDASLRPLGGPGGEFPAWSADGRSIGFSLGRSIFRYELATEKLQESVVHIEQPRSIPAGRILLEGARLITMRGDYGEFNSWQYPMGQATPKVLEAMGVLVYSVDRPEEVKATIDAAARSAFNGGQSVAVLLRQKLLGIKNFGKK